MGPLGPTGAFSPHPLKSQGDNSAHATWAPEWAPVGPRMGPCGPLWAPPFGAFGRSLAASETWDGPRRAGAVGAGWAPAAGVLDRPRRSQNRLNVVQRRVLVAQVAQQGLMTERLTGDAPAQVRRPVTLAGSQEHFLAPRGQVFRDSYTPSS